MPSRDSIIELQDVTKIFDDQPALSHLNLSIQNGEFLTFLGPSGCGKTTILRLIAGFETPTQGLIRINGQVVNDLPPNKRGVNTVFQSYALFPHMTVFDNVAFGLKLKGLPMQEIKSQVAEALNMVKLNGFEDRKPVQLSGGQQQRVAVARAVVNKPLVLLLDEPLSALDYKLRKEMQVELKHLHRKLGITFVFVTHDQEEAFTMSDRVVVMNQGAIEQIGTPREVYEEPENLFVARFVGEINMLPGTVQTQNGRFVEAMVEGTICKLVSKRSFTAGQRIKVLLRPEDMWIWKKGARPAHGDLGAAAFSFFGRIEDTIYKGTTLDISIVMDSGQRIQATEFFNEDDEAWNFKAGDEVEISWVEGWEVVLPDA